MHIHSSQYNYILHGLPDVTLQSTRHDEPMVFQMQYFTLLPLISLTLAILWNCRVVKTWLPMAPSCHLTMLLWRYALHSMKWRKVYNLTLCLLQNCTWKCRNIAWFTGSDIRTSSNFAWSIRNVKCFNSLNLQEMHNIHLLNKKTIVDLCLGRHEVLLNSKLNHIDLRSASVNMMFTVP